MKSDGADVVFPPGFANRDGDPLPLIVQKATGSFNYAASDLACVIDRVEHSKADLALYVIDARPVPALPDGLRRRQARRLGAADHRVGPRGLRHRPRPGPQAAPEPLG
ncbi:MAG: arginine--tRNA ligase [Ilumatobacteraceae bacterium]